MEWIQKIRGDNFLGIYDIVLDVYKEFEILPNNIVINLFPTMIRFPILCPMEGVNHRDNYCKIRWNAVEFLKEKGYISEFKLIERPHRWGHKIAIKIDEIKFIKLYEAMNNEYKERDKEDGQVGVSKSFWDLLHPRIIQVSKKLFDGKHYSQSAFEAMKEVNNCVKKIVKDKSGKELDGATLMNAAFSVNNPIIILDDLSTLSGKDIQVGYMQIFSGSMIGVRNPKAHDAIEIDAKRSIHFLYLASLLMFKIDERKH